MSKASEQIKQETTPLITTNHLEKASEGWLLRLAMLFYEIDHPNESINKALASLTGLTEPTVSQAMAGKGFIGAGNWLKVQKEINIHLYELWIRAQNEKLERQKK